MQIDSPRYVYREDFTRFREYLASAPHARRHFEKKETIWEACEPIDRVYYFESGVGMLSFLHERGWERILHYNGSGSVFPGCHLTRFKLEQSLRFVAMTPMDALEFSLTDFRALVDRNLDLAHEMMELYARWTNLFLYEAAHQGRNDLMMRLCNAMYLLLVDQKRVGISPTRIDLTQTEVAEMVGVGREAVAGCLAKLKQEGLLTTSRGHIDVPDANALLDYCSYETFPM